MSKEYDTVQFRENLSKGTLLLKAGKHQQALAPLEAAYAADPDHFDVAFNLAGAYILNKKFEQSAEILEKLTEADPENPEIWQNLGAAYLGNPVLATETNQLRAVDAFVHALNLKPTMPNVAYNIGLIHKDRREWQAAFKWFEIAVKTDPEDRDAKYWIVQMMEKLESGE